MLVNVTIDIARDISLMTASRNDAVVFAMLSMYEEDNDETYMKEIGRHIWNTSPYPGHMLKYCEGNIFDFRQSDALMFTFQTDEVSALLFQTGCPRPRLITVRKPTPTTNVIFPKEEF